MAHGPPFATSPTGLRPPSLEDDDRGKANWQDAIAAAQNSKKEKGGAAAICGAPQSWRVRLDLSYASHIAPVRPLLLSPLQRSTAAGDLQIATMGRVRRNAEPATACISRLELGLGSKWLVDRWSHVPFVPTGVGGDDMELIPHAAVLF